MTEPALLKDQLDEQAVSELAAVFNAVSPSFDEALFYAQATQNLEELELKARVDHIIDALSVVLPNDFSETVQILNALAKHVDANHQSGWHSFVFWPVIDYVPRAGLAHPELALSVLEKLTPLFTAEFALRPFLATHFELTLSQLQKWTQHENEHVRRLASEGIRPRLPWAPQISGLKADPSAIWPILEALKDDDSLYVRRSVANNINDISKDHPEQVLAACQQWQQGASSERQWVIKHGLRSLIKQGHPKVFPLLGYSAVPQNIKSTLSLSDGTLSEGESISLNLRIDSDEDAYCVLDYKVGFVGAKGQTNWKVFKWQSVRLVAGETLVLSKTHPFRSYSTRRLHSGLHTIQCLLNGVMIGETQFALETR